MKVKTISRILLVILAVGVPGFVKFDQTGLTHRFGLINTESLTRIAVFAVVGFLFVSLILLKSPKISKSQASANNFWVVALLSYYGIFFIFSAMVLPMREFALAGYRIAEWVLVIALCWYYFAACRLSEVRISSVGDDFLSVMRVITSLPALVVLIGLVLVPDLAYTYSTETGTFRFGGYLYHPNNLGVLCGMGSVIFWISARRRLDKIWSIALFAFMLLTYSRGAMVGVVAYILYYNLVYSSFVRKVSSAFILLVLFIVFISGYAENFSRGTFSAFSRGESVKSITTLNARTVVWDASLKAITDSPWVGHGFIQGPKKLKDYFEQKWWAPTHSHNDVLNAGVAGGWLLAVFTLLIFIMMAFKMYWLKMPAKIKAVTGAVMVQGGVYSIITPVFSTAAYSIGVVMVILIGYLFMQPPLSEKNIRLSQHHAN